MAFRMYVGELLIGLDIKPLPHPVCFCVYLDWIIFTNHDRLLPAECNSIVISTLELIRGKTIVTKFKSFVDNLHLLAIM